VITTDKHKTKVVPINQHDVGIATGLTDGCLTQLRNGKRMANMRTIEKFLTAAEKDMIGIEHLDIYLNKLATRIFNLVCKCDVIKDES
jgi:hypothetical protein